MDAKPPLTPGRIRNRYTPTPRAHVAGGELDRPFNATPSNVPQLEELARDANGLHDPNGYDRRLAYTLAVISAWTYSDGQTLADKLEWYGLVGNTVYEFAIENPGMLVSAKAFFVRSASGSAGVLSFCGTAPDSIIDLLTDANVSFKTFGADDRQSVHTGFFDSVEVLWGDLSERLELARAGVADENDAKPEPLTALYLTGHSLGGAMAVVAAATILRSEAWDGLLRGVYTYGQPAVGNAAFVTPLADKLTGRYFRHVYASDVVPHLPPIECGPYCHFGTELRWDGSVWSGTTPSDPKQSVTGLQSRIAVALPLVGISFLTRRLPGIGTWAPPWPLSRVRGYSIDDHFPIHYLDTCRTALATTRAS